MTRNSGIVVLTAIVTVGLAAQTSTPQTSTAQTSTAQTSTAQTSTAQTSTPLAFEVAAIKPSDPAQGGGGIRPMPGNQRYVATGIPLRLMMTVAYTVTDRQISGGPSWVDTERFDIDAKAEKPGSIDDLHVMLQHLLEERFQLKLRHETKILPIWELQLEKGGPKMLAHDPTDKNFPPFSGVPGGVKGTNVLMNYFAFFLSRILDRTVIDKTGLPGRYDVNLEFTQEPRGPARAEGGGQTPVVPDGPSIFTALKDQLGLKLVSGKGPVDFLIIEHAEKPSGN